MKMMSKLFLVLLAGVLLTSCGEKYGECDTVKAVFTAVWGESATRAAGTAAGENVIGTLDILVFDTHGNLLTAGRNASGNQLVLDVPRGSAVCYAVGNAHTSLSGVMTEAELLSRTSRLVDNGASDFEMIGRTSHTFDGADNVNIAIDRFAVKVVLDGIEVALSDPSWAASGVTSVSITDMYLTNVNPSVDYGLTSTGPTASWFNQMERQVGAADTYIYESVGTAVADGGADAGKHYFYCYPNPTVSDTEGGAWSARHTRLVVQAILGGMVCYYPITLPVLERNHCYTIQGLVITGAGSDDPDVLDIRAPLSFTVSVTPWNPLNHNVDFL